MKNCKTVTTMSCVNQFFSFLTLVGCSDRSVRVYDLNQGKVVREGFIEITKSKVCPPPKKKTPQKMKFPPFMDFCELNGPSP